MSSSPAALHPGPPATLLDLERVPEGQKGEIIAGVLYTQPRPRPAHQDALGSLFGDLDGPFRRGRGGPGGWWILAEPGISHPDAAEFSPDLAGWRRERMAQLPPGAIDVVPDWICEILSPFNRRYDLFVKKRLYANIGVQHLWYVDLDERTLSGHRLFEGHWLELGIFGPGDKVSAPPFDAIEIDIAAWWDSNA